MDLDRLGLLLDIDHQSLSDAEGAGLLWLSNMYTFMHWLDQKALNIRSLNASSFYQHPAETLRAASQLFELDFSGTDIESVVNSDLLQRDSKSHSNHGSYAERKAHKDKVAEQLADEISTCMEWVADKSASHPVPEKLKRDLLS
jgi:hypothetical protein